ncbi:MAG: hypothetical protein K2Y37_07975 [Pirellulales bacterium]|nr:hypothetical protein [Pirellulales bacterium]
MSRRSRHTRRNEVPSAATVRPEQQADDQEAGRRSDLIEDFADALNADSGDGASTSAGQALVVRRHLRFGWWSLLVFLTLGIVLEALHGLKVSWYLSVDNDARRLMWTLAHAHGTLLAILQLAFAGSVRLVPGWSARGRVIASGSLLSAGVLVPMGFFLGGLNPQGGDPGLGIVLLPVGAVLLFAAVLLTACGMAGRS